MLFSISFSYVLLLLLSSAITFVSSDVCFTHVINMEENEMPQVFVDTSTWYSSIINNTASNSKLVYTYNHALHGFSAMLSPMELQSIRNSRGFISLLKDRPVKLHTTHSTQFLGLNHVQGAWPASNYGEGVIIGMVDSGIYPESPSFADHGLTQIPSKWRGECETGEQFNSSICNKKLIGARHFSKGLIAFNPNVSIPMNSPRDIMGHGTHTASISAGNYVDGASSYGYAPGTARGMAPRASLAVYKTIFDSRGLNCFSDTLAAIDQAIKDKVDVLSMSVSVGNGPLEQNPFAIATFAAMEQGIFVSMAAGNEGARVKSLANDFPWVTTVGSGTIDREFRGSLLLGNGISIHGYSLYKGKPIDLEIPIIHAEICTESKFKPESIIVCENEPPEYISESKLSAGAVFILNDIVKVTYVLDLSFDSETAILFVFPEMAKILLEYVTGTTNPRGRMFFQETSIGTRPAPIVANYSSRGPSFFFPSILKPDIVAPGDYILGAWIPGKNRTKSDAKYEFDSGTSMACPHVAGLAALLKNAHPEWSPAAMRSAMMTTADILDNTFRPIKDAANFTQSASSFAIGAGHINPEKALDPGLVYDAGREDYIRLLCSMNLTNNQIKAIVRSSHFDCSRPSDDLNYPSIALHLDANTPVSKVFTRTLTNVGDPTSLYSAKLTPIAGFNLTVEPSVLNFTVKYQKLSYQLHIQGLMVVDDPVITGYLIWVPEKKKTGGQDTHCGVNAWVIVYFCTHAC